MRPDENIGLEGNITPESRAFADHAALAYKATLAEHGRLANLDTGEQDGFRADRHTISNNERLSGSIMARLPEDHPPTDPHMVPKTRGSMHNDLDVSDDVVGH